MIIEESSVLQETALMIGSFSDLIFGPGAIAAQVHECLHVASD